MSGEYQEGQRESFLHKSAPCSEHPQAQFLRLFRWLPGPNFSSVFASPCSVYAAALSVLTVELPAPAHSHECHPPSRGVKQNCLGPNGRTKVPGLILYTLVLLRNPTCSAVSLCPEACLLPDICHSHFRGCPVSPTHHLPQWPTGLLQSLQTYLPGLLSLTSWDPEEWEWPSYSEPWSQNPPEVNTQSFL